MDDTNATRGRFTPEDLEAMRKIAAELGIAGAGAPTPTRAEQLRMKAEAQAEAAHYARRERLARAWNMARELTTLHMDATLQEVRQSIPDALPWPSYEPSIATQVTRFNDLFGSVMGRAEIVVWPVLETPAGRLQPVGAMIDREIVAVALERPSA